jgi:hypothetical protein
MLLGNIFTQHESKNNGSISIVDYQVPLTNQITSSQEIDLSLLTLAELPIPDKETGKWS